MQKCVEPRNYTNNFGEGGGIWFVFLWRGGETLNGSNSENADSFPQLVQCYHYYITEVTCRALWLGSLLEEAYVWVFVLTMATWGMSNQDLKSWFKLVS